MMDEIIWRQLFKAKISDIMEIQGNSVRKSIGPDTRKTPTFRVATEKGKLKNPLKLLDEPSDTPLSLSVLDNSKLSKF